MTHQPIKLTVDQAKRIIAVAPKTSPYYLEAQRVLFSVGYIPAPIKLSD
jgi:hypothetical protein